MRFVATLVLFISIISSSAVHPAIAGDGANLAAGLVLTVVDRIGTGYVLDRNYKGQARVIRAVGDAQARVATILVAPQVLSVKHLAPAQARRLDSDSRTRAELAQKLQEKASPGELIAVMNGPFSSGYAGPAQTGGMASGQAATYPYYGGYGGLYGGGGGYGGGYGNRYFPEEAAVRDELARIRAGR